MSAKMDEQALLALLRELAIDSQRVEHPAIASIEEYYAQGIELPDQGIKNLFLRNRKGTRHYLVLLDDAIRQDQLLGFHPLVNTATECIRYADLLAFLAHTGHEPRLIRV
ncbi:hypothetical protein [Pseudomonas aeruginosa]|uniref:hypothetical protein n=1 Tax=Pseudomonas aeruginosa TaxID=287 RepID=UPI0009BC7179|nr:hypothetical protein [Pseudomonas aeruginosa]ARC80390.1 hypothetical protein AXW93_16425 [Pseudomonas aeruginosa]MCO3582853.1 hypothetical protein [Pseudomonas aeruginosa]MCO3758189.1 hypothetical protein [Pseudomonas aeruginosa]MCX5484615.1 hypothetical protein [Pseudomonas aeruginosa]MCX5490668.1 hypothetical protein [Pseudomonas aeruginosa]